MPPFGAAYSNAELAAVANYVIAHDGGKAGRVTPDDIARRRHE
jgi:mono/diheme cytochrome c family protein